MKIKANENLIVVRYSNKYENECILKHQEVIKREGFVWFGKCGNVIRKVNAENILSQENPKVILYSKSGSYICELKDISYEEQTKNIPEYYKNLRNSKDECGYDIHVDLGRCLINGNKSSNGKKSNYDHESYNETANNMFKVNCSSGDVELDFNN